MHIIYMLSTEALRFMLTIDSDPTRCALIHAEIEARHAKA